MPHDIFGDGSTLLDAVDHFLFRDAEMEAICRHLYREVSLNDMADRLYIESLVMQLGSVGCCAATLRVAGASEHSVSSGGLTRSQARRVLEYIEI